MPRVQSLRLDVDARRRRLLHDYQRALQRLERRYPGGSRTGSSAGSLTGIHMGAPCDQALEALVWWARP